MQDRMYNKSLIILFCGVALYAPSRMGCLIGGFVEIKEV